MEGDTKEQWQRLCEQAAREQDPEQLLILIGRINELLDAKEKRLHEQRAEAKAA